MQERRAVHRDRTYLVGQVAYNDRQSTMNCLVRNFSQDGAKIAFAHTALIPSEFEVVIPKKGESRRARIIWQDDGEAGVAFLQAESPSVISIESARRIRKLQTERDTLASRVAHLTEPA